METVLVIDDEPQLRRLIVRMLELEGYGVFEADDCLSGIKQLKSRNPLVVLCDVLLPDGNGVDLVSIIKKFNPETEVILLTAYGNIADGVLAIKNGAFDYITKGDDNHKIIPIINRAIDQAKKNRGEFEKLSKNKVYSFDSIIGVSACVNKAVSLALKVSVTDVPVLLFGETGTGKEVFAQSIHKASKRSKGNFVAVNCSAFSKDLLESELFGYKTGAFTGAVRDKKGLLEAANGGTLFLDEIGEMAFELQSKLLRVLENGEFIKIGDSSITKVDIRIIAATNRDIKKEIEKNNFREDLYYRLSVFCINLPPLRERMEDIPLLCKFFLEKFAPLCSLENIDKISTEAIEILKKQMWRGNIRELRNVIERSLIVCEGNTIEVSDLPVEIQSNSYSCGQKSANSEFELSDVERCHIEKVLKHTKGNKTEAARLMKIGLTTLYRKIEEYKL